MSRAQQFYQPTATGAGQYDSQPLSAPGPSTTRPLQFSRSAARPMNAIGSSFLQDSSSYAPPNTAPLAPYRPQRSELRHRRDVSTSERASFASQDQYRDSVATSHSDFVGRPYQGLPSSANTGPLRPQYPQSAVQANADQTSPGSIHSAVSAMNSVGLRRRQTAEDEEEDTQYQRERQLELEAERARQQRIREKAPGMRSRGTRAGEIDAVLEQVKDGWEFVIDPDFNHVDLALQLLDKSSLGKNMESFRRTKNMLSKALRGSVDKHYQAFAASLPHHASLFSHLNTVQTEITSARSALQEAKESLGSKRADLVQLWNRGQLLEEMIRTLDQIEHLKAVPDLLETLMSEKRLLPASILLVRSLKIINKTDMREIGAISDLRSYLEAQEMALRDILVDELQSHLYLKSFWCESRWAAYAPGQREFLKVDFETHIRGQGTGDSPDSPPSKQSKFMRYLNSLSLRPNEPPYDVNENNLAQNSMTGSSSSNSIFFNPRPPLSSDSNPEADSFVYMETLLESLAVLGKLGNALDSIGQRLPGEIFALVETTLDEIEERAEFVKRKSSTSWNGSLGKSEGAYLFVATGSAPAITPTGSKSSSLRCSTLRLSALESLAKRVDHEILKDLFWTLYSKLVAVAQGMRVITEVANRIGSRRDYKDASGAKPGMLFPLPEIWSHIQIEVQTLIRNYLIDEQQGSAVGRNPISSINEILRDGKFNRERVKPVFRFSDTDLKATNKILKPHEDGLTRVLKDTMPGLAPGAGDVTQTIVSSITDERLLGNDQHHRLLIRPDAFHVTVLFQPTLSFLYRIAEILPPGSQVSQNSGSVLDEFVLKVYLPQLEEKVLDLFHDAVTGPEAFQPDPVSLRLMPEPLVKASTHLMALINSLCAMLNTSPFHRENYSRLILGVVIQFYQRCSDRFQSLTVDPNAEITQEPRVALAAQWAQRSELQTCMTELMVMEPSNRDKQQQVHRQEAILELEFLGENSVTKDDLVVSIKNLASLASLQRSVSWFISELDSLRARPEEYLSTLSPASLETTPAVTPVMPPLLPESLSDQSTLPLSREMSLRFQALLKTYEQLSNFILDTIRLDLRCRAIHYLDSSMRYGTYDSNYEAIEPDPYIVDLNTELVQCDEFMTIHLPKKEREYVFTGLGHLMQHILITSARHLHRPNAFGIKKILRNILALQQSVKSLTDNVHEASFERAKEYFSLFSSSPQDMLEGIRKKPSFTFEEYQAMLNLQCGVHQGQTLDRNYSMYLLDLQCLDLEKMDVTT